MSKHKSGKSLIKYTDVWGLRDKKSKWLESHNVANTKWQELSPSDPHFFLVPRDERGREIYEGFISVKRIFPVNSTGILTGRDKFVIDFSKQSLEVRMRVFRGTSESDEFVKTTYRLKDKPSYKWFVSSSRQELRELENWERNFTKILYRPFDERWIYYHPAVVFWPRLEVMQHMLQPNLALTVCRQQAQGGFQHCLVANKVVESCYVSNKTREIGYVLPLYIYNEVETGNSGTRTVMMVFDRAYQVKRSNLDPELHALLNNTYSPQPVTTPPSEQRMFDIAPEEIFYYIYAVLYSNTYREKYQGFLKIDFPRVPFTKNYSLFQKLAALGEKLVTLHLLQSPELDKPIAKFWGKGSNLVGMRKFIDEEQAAEFVDIKIAAYWPEAGEKLKFKSRGIVKINDDGQFFGPIPEEVWNYPIGGYQVLDKWLKDRKGRYLSADDIKHYCRIATALAKTIETQKEIDRLYPRVEENLIEASI